jgi:hypothetical protein
MHIPLAHKTNIPRDSNLEFVCSGDPDAILVGSTVSDHNSFETAGIQLFGLFPGHMNECLCANCNEMGNVRLLTIECLVGGHSVEGGSWAVFLQMCNGTGDLSPELFQDLGFGEDGVYPFTNSSVGSFGYSVLFQSVGGCLFVMNASLGAQICHLFVIFSTAVVSHRFDASSILFENIAKLEEALADFLCRFRFYNEEIRHPCCIVDKNQDITRVSEADGGDPAPDVTVNPVAKHCAPRHGRNAEVASWGAEDTCLAGVSFLGESFRLDGHSFDEFLGEFEVPGPQMG